MTTEAVMVSYQDNTHSCSYIAVNMCLKQLKSIIIMRVSLIIRYNFVVYLHIPIFSSAVVVCPNNHGCSHGCAIVNHTEQCFCPSGYALQNITQCNGTQVVYVLCWYMYVCIATVLSNIKHLYTFYNYVQQNRSIMYCFSQILMSALCSAHVNKCVLTLLGHSSVCVDQGLSCEMTAHYVKVSNQCSSLPLS